VYSIRYSVPVNYCDRPIFLSIYMYMYGPGKTQFCRCTKLILHDKINRNNKKVNRLTLKTSVSHSMNCEVSDHIRLYISLWRNGSLFRWSTLKVGHTFGYNGSVKMTITLVYREIHVHVWIKYSTIVKLCI